MTPSNLHFLSNTAEARAYREEQDKKAVMERLARVKKWEQRLQAFKELLFILGLVGTAYVTYVVFA
jgi:hypothetical protein